MATLPRATFADYDDPDLFYEAQTAASAEYTRNFVVDFGEVDARIAFDFEQGDFEALLKEGKDYTRNTERLPVRWINIWAPHRQETLVRALGQRYRFSPRLLAIICSEPTFKPWDEQGEKHRGTFMTKVKEWQREQHHHHDKIDGAPSAHDIELGNAIQHRANFESGLEGTSHYDIANQMINYQSIDYGEDFLCVGANWMHLLPGKHDENSKAVHMESQRRLWSWLIICNDNTVISIHEDTGPINNTEIVKSVRENTLSVLRQLSRANVPRNRDDPISLQSVREILAFYADHADLGSEGASILFYYLFDDWTSAYRLIAAYHHRLEDLSRAILGDIHKRLDQTPDIEIIPRLHVLGREMRGMQHLYENYSNTIERILLASKLEGRRGVSLSTPARQRFERLGDRIKLLVLSEIGEYLVEKDALVSSYFNITAQKDSEATARLTRSATLLAKLSVLFLPVSLMTAYFSVQIDDLEGVYTAKTYWVAFAVIMSISFVGIFFFSRLLMFVSDTIDDEMKAFARYLRRHLHRRAD